jgi:MoaA/NifB/PqqE/SkfB family radical SAM enzyme
VQRKYIIKGIKSPVEGTINIMKSQFGIGTIKPRWVSFLTTEVCNSHCTMCNIWQNKKTSDPLSPDEIQRILKDPLLKGVELIMNVGGEPTIRPDLTDLIIAEHDAIPNANIQLSTNALLPERAYQTIKAVLEHGVKIDVGISIEGIGEYNDKIRGVAGGFEKANTLIKKLVELKSQYPDKLGVGLGTMLMDETTDSIWQVKNYAEQLNLTFGWNWFNPSASTYYNYKTEVNGHDKKEEQKRFLRSFLPNIYAQTAIDYLDGKPVRFRCFALHSFFFLKSNGDVIPCLDFWDTSAGNVRENTITEIYKSEKAKEIRSKVAACHGCLNGCSIDWSWRTSLFPYLKYYFKNPKLIGALK